MDDDWRYLHFRKPPFEASEFPSNRPKKSPQSEPGNVHPREFSDHTSRQQLASSVFVQIITKWNMNKNTKALAMLGRWLLGRWFYWLRLPAVWVEFQFAFRGVLPVRRGVSQTQEEDEEQEQEQSQPQQQQNHSIKNNSWCFTETACSCDPSPSRVWCHSMPLFWRPQHAAARPSSEWPQLDGLWNQRL